MSSERQLLTTDEAAEFLGMTAITLRKARCNGKVRAHIPPCRTSNLGAQFGMTWAICTIT